MGLTALVMVGELWASSLGDLMKQATSIELVEVTARRDGVLAGTLVEGIRSTRAPSSRVEIDLGQLGHEAKRGDRVLVICDAGECPRALGVERDGWFQLTAQEPMDGAFVYPDVVSHVALPVLAAGRPAPPICVKGTVAFLDDPTPRPVEVLAGALDGAGSGTLAGAPIKAQIGRWRSERGDGIGLRLEGAKGGIDLVGAVVGTKGNGCLGGAFHPANDTPRTFSGATQQLAGTAPAGPIPFARGVLAIGKSRHAIELVLDGGELAIKSDLATGRVASRTLGTDASELGFSLQSTGVYPLLNVVIPTQGRSIVAAFSANRTLAVRFERKTEKDVTVLGTAQFTYVKGP